MLSSRVFLSSISLLALLSAGNTAFAQSEAELAKLRMLNQVRAKLLHDQETASKNSRHPGAPRLNDIDRSSAKSEIAILFSLGVFEPISGRFEPDKPATRREFVRWLVKTINAVMPKFELPQRKIKLAESGMATFWDVPTHDPDFKYIQGLANAGVVIGVDNRHFKPDQPITREEMLAIKLPASVIVDGGTPNLNGDSGKAYSDKWDAASYADKRSVSPRLKSALGMCVQNAAIDDPIPSVFGPGNLLKPMQPVTRAEAAKCIAQPGGRADYSVVSSK